MRRLRLWAPAVAAALIPAAVLAGGIQGIDVLSNRADVISGGDALVAVRLDAGVDAAAVSVTLNGHDVTGMFAVRQNGQYAAVVPRWIGSLLAGVTTGVVVLVVGALVVDVVVVARRLSTGLPAKHPRGQHDRHRHPGQGRYQQEHGVGEWDTAVPGVDDQFGSRASGQNPFQRRKVLGAGDPDPTGHGDHTQTERKRGDLCVLRG